MSRWGDWIERGGLPAFTYTADQYADPAAEWDPIGSPPTRRHWVMVGNRAIQMQCANDGRVALWDERFGLRWLCAPDPAGTGLSIIEEPARAQADAVGSWGSAFDGPVGAAAVPVRNFGPTWFEIIREHAGLELQRLVLCPEGDLPWVLVRVRLFNPGPDRRSVSHVEQWEVKPRFVNLASSAQSRREAALAGVVYRVDTTSPGRIVAIEERTSGFESSADTAMPRVFGPPIDIVLEAIGDTTGEPRTDGAPHPTLELVSGVDLDPGGRTELWYRFGDCGSGPDGPWSHPASVMALSLDALAARLPRASATSHPGAARELTWHGAVLTGGACADELLGNHKLDQASAYSFEMGFNGAARDPLQHAMPLVYTEPDLALSVLRNTCSWSAPSGELPYALDGSGAPWTGLFQPSDQPLWALWLAAEYAAATGDLAAFDQPLGFHPVHAAEPVPLAEHLRRQFRFFVDSVGRGDHGHVRIRNADWNDMAVIESGVDRSLMAAEGESVLNSAMAAWVLPVYAGLCTRLGDGGLAEEARTIGEELRRLVATEWNGRWFRRAYAPGRGAIGDDDLWLEVQPWAILCGATSDEQARALLQTIGDLLAGSSPLGARLRWSPAVEGVNGIGEGEGAGEGGGERDGRGPVEPIGEGTRGGIWYSVNMTLTWAAAAVDTGRAWDWWHQMSLEAHTRAYPAVWEGTLSGPDTYNAPESARPGRTWGLPGFSMQRFPVNNLHSHAQPLLSYLRLLGIGPRPDGSLAAGPRAGAQDVWFESSTFRLDPDGHGMLRARGPVVIDSRHGSVTGGPGTVRW